MFAGDKVGREQRSLYLSAARSYLFNQILACRVTQKIWDQAIAGDTYQFDLSNGFFKSEVPDAEIIRRVREKDIHPTGSLWGKGALDVSADTLSLEQAVIEKNRELAEGLIAYAVEKDRRALRVNVQDLQWNFVNENILELTFFLPAGSYATSLLREIIKE
jgi:tRNA pseudouridine13 synthase